MREGQLSLCSQMLLPLGVPPTPGASNAPHKVFPKTAKWKCEGFSPPYLIWGMQHRARGPGSPSVIHQWCAACSSVCVGGWGMAGHVVRCTLRIVEQHTKAPHSANRHCMAQTKTKYHKTTHNRAPQKRKRHGTTQHSENVRPVRTPRNFFG